jgi:hypothetical protein
MMKTGLKQTQVKTGKPVMKSTPRLPHERDEAGDNQSSGTPQKSIKQAYQDIQRGLVDTDLREQRGVEAVVKPPKKAAPAAAPTGAPKKRDRRA